MSLAQDPLLLPYPHPGFTFPQHQTPTYSVDWRVFTAGVAVIHFDRTRPSERIAASADTSGAINMLFHVADNLQSDFDREKGCTYNFNKQTVEGRRQNNSTLRIDYGGNRSILKPGERADQAC